MRATNAIILTSTDLYAGDDEFNDEGYPTNMRREELQYSANYVAFDEFDTDPEATDAQKRFVRSYRGRKFAASVASLMAIQAVRA